MQKGERVLEKGCAGGAPLHHSAEELRQTGKAMVHELPSSHPPPNIWKEGRDLALPPRTKPWAPD